MYQKKTKKLIKRGSNITRLREARRQQRLHIVKSEPEDAPSHCAAVGAGADKAAQSRLLLELAWKTVALMHNNRVIQQKIVDLQKETSDFLKSTINYPESQQYHEKFRRYGLALRSQSESLSQTKIKAVAHEIVTLTKL